MKKMAFVLKGYPRVSETFIAQEMYMLEQAGYKLNIISMKKAREEQRQPVVAKIKAPITYIPEYILKSPIEFLKGNFKALFLYPNSYIYLLMISLLGTLATRQRRPLKSFLQAAWTVGELELGKNPDIEHLHSHFIHLPTEITWWMSRLSGLKYSISAHAKDIYTISKAAVVKRVNDSELIMTCTEFNYQFLKSLPGINKEKVNKVYHGINPDIFTPSNERAIADQGPLYLSSVGRLVGKKGYHYIFEALKILKEKGIEFQYDLFGEGSLKEELVNLSKELGLESEIHFHFTATHPDIIERFKKKGIFICGSQLMEDGDKDGIPNTVAEAMGMELPVVATNVSGIPELITHKKDGFLVEQKSAEELVRGILAFYEDKDFADKIGKEGRKRVMEFFNCHQCINDCERLLGSV